MDHESDDGLVTIRVEGNEVSWVGIKPSFRQLDEPPTVLATVIAMVNEFAPRPAAQAVKNFDFGPGYDYDTMDRINTELARLSNASLKPLDEYPSSNRQITAVARDGFLVTVLATEQYMSRVLAQQLSEDLTEAVQAMSAAIHREAS